MNNNDYSLKVINLSGSTSITGRLIKFNTARSNSFMLLGNNETNMLGVIAEGGISSGLPCGIKVNGSAYVFVNGVVKQGELIRSLKTGDPGAKGTAIKVKSTDISYLQVGIALESGSNKIILVGLNIAFVTSATTSMDWNSITGTPTTVAGYGITDALQEEFETVSKNIRTYPYTLTYGVDGISTIVYDLGGGLSITKTFNYTLSVLTSIVLSGDMPSGIELTKTLHYTGADLTSVVYS